MSTIKTDRIDFEKLLNGLDPVDTPVGVVRTEQQSVPAPVIQQQQPVSSVVDNTSSEDIMEAKMFEFNYEATRKGTRKKARKKLLSSVLGLLQMLCGPLWEPAQLHCACEGGIMKELLPPETATLVQ